MSKPSLALALALAAASAATAGTTSETVQFDYDPFAGTTELVLNGFDTMGGTRRLNRAVFEFHHNFSLDIYLESTGPTAVQQGDYGINIGFLSIYQLGTVNGGEGDPPFFGPGGFFISDFSADLGAYDGVPGNDGPDSFRDTFTDAFTSVLEFRHADQMFLDALTDTGPLTTIFGGFGELFFYWNNDPGWPEPMDFFPEYPTDAALWLALQNFRHFGEFTIDYHYTNVPAPAAAAPMALLALGVRRRRPGR